MEELLERIENKNNEPEIVYSPKVLSKIMENMVSFFAQRTPIGRFPCQHS
jgi:hypothetical protein